jgi:hypothetical protein
MTYSDALAIVLGLIGREIAVSVIDNASGAIAAACSGVLRMGHDADGGHGDLEDEAWTFILEGGGASFHLERTPSTARTVTGTAWR